MTVGVLRCHSRTRTGAPQGTARHRFHRDHAWHSAPCGSSTPPTCCSPVSSCHLQPIQAFTSAEFTRATSPYFRRDEPFSHAKFGMYLTTQLDGYSIDDLKALVDRSVSAKAEHGPLLLRPAGVRSRRHQRSARDGDGADRRRTLVDARVPGDIRRNSRVREPDSSRSWDIGAPAATIRTTRRASTTPLRFQRRTRWPKPTCRRRHGLSIASRTAS